MKLSQDSLVGCCLILYHSFISVLSQSNEDAIAFASNFDYCTITCNGKKHTMCEYPAGGPAECGSFDRVMTKTMRDVLLDVHNSLRQQVAMGKGEGGQPQAGNMMELTWSDEAAAIAQRWADQCTAGEEKDECRSLKDKQPGGQNLVNTHTNTQVDLYFFQKITVLEWFKTGSDFDKDSVHSYKPDPATAPYSQIVWGTTASLGCGYSHGQLNGTDVWRLVCNYYPAGNVAGSPVYLEGKPCSKCPNVKCAQKTPGLCAPPSDMVYNRNTTKGGSPGGPTGLVDTLAALATLLLLLYWALCG